MEVKLVVVSETQTGREIPVAGAKYLIGRGEDCQLRPQSSLVSRKHCAILTEEGVVAIEDFGSTNGTFVNDERITQRRELKNGDRIRVGTLTVELRLHVGVGGPNRPKVADVEQAVHTVAQGAAANDDIDVSGWLGEEPESPVAPSAFSSQSTLAIGGDTFAGKSMLDTSALPKRQTHPKKKEEAKEKPKESPTKTAGKKPVKPMTDNSGQAADNALRQFFHRKKP
jgi:pSer/pThr/pTyr-binding forkhead associated (FHA) protein